MAKKVTISEIAVQLGLSKSTVSKALSRATDISAETRAKVLSCASMLGYELKSRSPDGSRKVAVFLEGLDYESVDQFCHEVLLGFEAEAGSASIGVTVIPLRDEAAFSGRYAQVMSGPSYLGSFFIGFRPHSAFVHQFRELGKPAVLLDNAYDAPLSARIGSDSAAGMYSAVAHLAGLGHKKIAYLGGEAESFVTEERKNGYLAALARCGLPQDAGLLAFGHFYEELDERLIAGLVQSGATAIVCASDVLALGAVQKLRGMKLRVPQEISVIGYDGVPLSKFAVPALTTVSQNGLLLGRNAFRLLVRLLEGEPISQLVLRPELIVRESTAPPAKSGMQADLQSQNANQTAHS